MQIWGSVKKCQNYRFFDIFWDILDKRKSNLGQECVEGELLTFQDKIGTIAPDFPGKIRIFSVLDLLFHLFLPNIWHSHPYKIYIFELSNNRGISRKCFILLSLRLWIW